MTKKLDHDTIRACIAALPERVPVDRYDPAFNLAGGIPNDASTRALETLLPDPAQELVGEFCKTTGYIISPPFIDFARWILEHYEAKRK